MFESILVAVDGSENSTRAYETAVALARQQRASLTILLVRPPPPAYPAVLGTPAPILHGSEEEVRWGRELVSRLREAAHASRVETVTGLYREGNVVDTILDAATETSAKLVVLGARGLSRTARLFLGSVSDAVVHHAPCAVLIVRR